LVEENGALAGGEEDELVAAVRHCFDLNLE